MCNKFAQFDVIGVVRFRIRRKDGQEFHFYCGNRGNNTGLDCGCVYISRVRVVENDAKGASVYRKIFFH